MLYIVYIMDVLMNILIRFCNMIGVDMCIMDFFGNMGKILIDVLDGTCMCREAWIYIKDMEGFYNFGYRNC